MDRNRRAFRAVVAVLAVMIAARSAVAGWCGASEDENWKEFYSLYGANLSSGGTGRPVAFVLGAPWCPYCAQLMRTFRPQQFNFDIRFVPKDAQTQLHRDQLADIVVDGGAASVIRVFEQHRANVSKITPQQHSFINDVQLSVLYGMKVRYERPDRQMASPTTVYMTRGGIFVYVGMPNLRYIADEIVGSGDGSRYQRARRFLTSGIPPSAVIPTTPYAKKANVRLRILPDVSAFTADCLQQGQGFRNARKTVVDGREWFVFNPLPEYPRVTLYAPASDFFFER